MTYKEKILAMVRSGEIPTGSASIVRVHVWHDPWCGIYKGRACNCDFEITVGKPLRRREVDR